MWVRHQNRMVIIKVNIVYLCYSNILVKWSLNTSIEYDDKFELGFYSTKEQALQVLDEIEERINEGCPFVYQMPTEEAVQALLDADKVIEEVDREFEAESVTITDMNYIRHDEIYCRFYKCPKCGDEWLMVDHKYCPECGIKINWNLKEEK